MIYKTDIKVGPANLVIGMAVLFGLFGALPILMVDWPSLANGIFGFFLENFPTKSYSAEALLSATLETLLLAVVGTTLGFWGALLFSRSAVFQQNLILASVGRILSQIFRATPDLVIALLLLQVFGIGPIAGSLAIALGTFGVSTKLLNDAKESQTYASERELIRLGASPTVALLSSLVSVSRDLAPQFLLRLEANLRIATIIGVVGGGGLGELLRASFGTFDYQKGLVVIFIIAALIVSFEFSTLFWRSRLASEKFRPDVSTTLAGFWLVPILVSLVSIFYWQVQSGIFRPLQLGEMFIELVQVDFFSFGSSIASGTLQSLQMAFAASVIAIPLAFALGALSSGQVLNMRWLTTSLRLALALGRSVPTVVLAFVLVTQLGLGYQSGLIAMVIGLTLFFSRLVGDAVDSVPRHVTQSMRDLGLNKLQIASTLIFGALAQRSRSIVFFALDFAVRYTVILGLVGAGGLGSVISDAIRVQDFQTLSACLVLLVLMIWSIEAFQKATSTRKRSKIN